VANFIDSRRHASEFCTSVTWSATGAVDRTFFDLGGNCGALASMIQHGPDLDDLHAALSAPGALPDAALQVRVGPLTLLVTREADEVYAQWETEAWCWPVEVGAA